MPVSFQISGWVRRESISESLFSREGISKIPPHGNNAFAYFFYLLLVVCNHWTLALAPAYSIVNAAMIEAAAHISATIGPYLT